MPCSSVGSPLHARVLSCFPCGMWAQYQLALARNIPQQDGSSSAKRYCSGEKLFGEYLLRTNLKILSSSVWLLRLSNEPLLMVLRPPWCYHPPCRVHCPYAMAVSLRLNDPLSLLARRLSLFHPGFELCTLPQKDPKFLLHHYRRGLSLWSWYVRPT